MTLVAMVDTEDVWVVVTDWLWNKIMWPINWFYS